MLYVWAKEDLFKEDGERLLTENCQYELDTEHGGIVVIRFENGDTEKVGYYTESNVFVKNKKYDELFFNYEEGEM